jgi:hypothetical protein
MDLAKGRQGKKEAGITFVLPPIRTLCLFNIFHITAAIVHIVEHRLVIIFCSLLWLNCLDVLDPDQDKLFRLKKAKWKQKQIMLSHCTSSS